jgi:uncharacterized membrane protein
VVGIENHEYESVEYTVVVQLQDVAVGDESIRVLEREELRRFETTLAHNETWRQRHGIAPTLTGERLRLTYLLYRGAAPGTPTAANAYQQLHLWVNVTRG